MRTSGSPVGSRRHARISVAGSFQAWNIPTNTAPERGPTPGPGSCDMKLARTASWSGGNPARMKTSRENSVRVMNFDTHFRQVPSRRWVVSMAATAALADRLPR